MIIAGILENTGLVPVSLREAAYVIVNSCAVKSPTENKVIDFLKKASKMDKKVIITGCLPKTNLRRIEREVPDFSAAIDPQSVDKIAEVLGRIERGETGIVKVTEKSPNKLKLPRQNERAGMGIIQISEGCDMVCSYCCARIARGKLQCFPVDDIINEAKRLIEAGCKDLQVTSQDSVSYSYNGIRLPQLIERICKVPGDFKIRVGMMNPTYVREPNLLAALIAAYKNPKVSRFLHLPVQSGSDKILKAMKRGYTVSDFEKIVAAFRAEIPDIYISTDVIVGFPGETDEDFQKTIALIEKIKPGKVNLSKFGARPNTEAARMEQLPAKKVNERSRRLHGLLKTHRS
jgi:MiaB-like tRNA modifying enzyme